jgi:hypothetical protein
MSLLQEAPQREPLREPSPLPPPARVDERTRLNYRGFYDRAFVRVFVSDTSACDGPAVPGLALQIADCTNEINLEFSLRSAAERENSLHKIDTLLDALSRFREGLAAEARLAAAREYGERRPSR